ncbi:type III effector protein [Streptomyces bathyalis]|uniref:Type III effector protein n=1 Tax=Streptomyces bathyalis TaxID=2710756 RepID=A0A7T1T2M2_9ACTN|nr:type III effector protein [Streptomyces bathyalis]QPP05255.1 type III effector protein [Streptomyces bathyalis]
MTADDQGSASSPASFLAATAALETIEEAVRSAQTRRRAETPGPETRSEQALAALLLLRELRDQLAGWEPGLIETAREAGASWADLAHPLGVASRQAAERRYLRLRPGAPGANGEERIRAVRDRRAADRSVSTWARGNAADLRQLAGQVTALADLPAEARAPLAQALGSSDPAALLGPLNSARRHLTGSHDDLAAQVDALTRHTDALRQASGEERRPAT